MFTIRDMNQQSGEGGYIYGMNTVDPPKSLRSGECLLLENCVPAFGNRPRNGYVDLVRYNSSIGFTGASEYLPCAIEIENPAGESFLFQWSRDLSDSLEFTLEMHGPDLTARATFMQIRATSSAMQPQMMKMYNSIYILFSEPISVNRTFPLLIKNVIVYWDAQSSSWKVRSWGIDSTPSIVNSKVENVVGNGSVGSAAFVELNYDSGFIYTACGQDGPGLLSSVQKSFNMAEWNPVSTQFIELLLDENGEPFIDGESVVATFSARRGHALISLQGRLWIIGGEDGFGGYLSDVWSSEDGGATWVKFTNTPVEWTGRSRFGCVVFGDKIWILGGYNGSARAEVFSFDGTTFQIESPYGFLTRYDHRAVVFDNSIWVMCGAGRTDCMRSTDGLTWTQISPDIGAGELQGYGLVVHGGYMWLMGGESSSTQRDDVRRSSDGITWSIVTSNPGWSARSWFGILSFANKMWVVGGFGGGTTYFGDSWSSTDGITWAQTSGGLTKNKHYSYGATFVRREDTSSKLSSMSGFTYAIWRTVDGQLVVGSDELLLGGTVSLSGTALTGVETHFTSDLEVGKRIRIGGTFRYYTVTGITNDEVAEVTNSSGDSYSGERHSLLPDDNDTITTSKFNPGTDESPESVDARSVLNIYSTTDYGRMMLTVSGIQSAVAKGATHLRLYRTEGASTQLIAEGLPHKFLVDIGLAFSDNSNTVVYFDSLSDDTLMGETNVVGTTGFEVAPAGRFASWDRERVWMSIGGGYWNHSLGASTDVEFPQKYASLFNAASQRVVCDPDDGQNDRGSIVFDGSLYTFKSSKVHILDNSDPVNIPRLLSEGIGCDFPNTITTVDHPKYGRAVFFLSNDGPAMIQGGTVSLIQDFNLSEVWPGGYLQYDSENSQSRSQSWKEKVHAIWHKSAWRISVPGQSIPKIYGYSLSPDGRYHGGFIEIPAAVSPGTYVLDFNNLLRVDSETCYIMSSLGGYYRVSHYLKNGVFQDSYLGYGNYSIRMRTRNRPRGLDEMTSVMGEISDIVLHADVTDNADLLFVVRVDAKKFYFYSYYAEQFDSALSGVSLDNFRTQIHAIVQEGGYGWSFDVTVAKTIPIDGEYTFYGVDMNVNPMPEFGAEFVTAGGDRYLGEIND